MSAFWLDEQQESIRDGVAKVLAPYNDDYWRRVDETGTFPEDFVADMAGGGWLGVAMPEHVGGAGLGLTEASIVMQTVAQSGAGFSGASAIHLNIFGPMPIVKFGTDEQRERHLPRIISGEDKMCFAVTEPNSGLDTASLETRAERTNDGYVINGRKIWTTSAQRANKILIIARTTPKDQVAQPHLGLSLFYTDLNRASIEAQPIPKMGRRAVECNTLFIDNLRVPKEDLVGEEGKGFQYLISGLNPERVLFAVEPSDWAARRSPRRPSTPTSASCSAGPSARTRAFSIRLPRAGRARGREPDGDEGCGAVRRGRECGAEANAAKYLGAEAGFRACETSVLAHGGMGYAREYYVERYFREAMIARIAPVSREMILNFIAERVLHLPKSY
jgi:acyl-CoA dehydrogenase